MAANSRVPFVPGIFWKVFVVVALLVVAAWLLIPRLTAYQITAADYGGSSISAVIFSYLVHLWLLPPEGQRPDGDPPRQPDDPA